MDIIVKQEQSRVPVTVFQIQGRVNLGNSDELERMALEAHQSGARDMILDLTNVPSMTSAGLRAILYIYKLLNQGPGGETGSPVKSSHLKLVDPVSDVLRVLQTAGFDRYIDIYPDLQEALDSF